MIMWPVSARCAAVCLPDYRRDCIVARAEPGQEAPQRQTPPRRIARRDAGGENPVASVTGESALETKAAHASAAREPVLNPVDRVSEFLFGLYMALTFVGAVSVADTGRADIRALFAAALGCNLAWVLADAVMYLVRTITDRGRLLTLVRTVRAVADPASGRRLIAASLSRPAAVLVSETEIEAIRGRVVAWPTVPERPRLNADDLLAALAVFLLVVASTFPVVLPFVLFDDVGTAKTASRAVALVLLFLGGLAVGRHAGYGGWKAGLLMSGLGAALVAAIMALGG